MKERCNKFAKEIKINEKKEVVKVTKTMAAKKARILADFDAQGTKSLEEYKQILSVYVGQPEWKVDEKFRSIRDELLK